MFNSYYIKIRKVEAYKYSVISFNLILIFKCVLNDICSHLQSLLPYIFRVVMYFLVFPTVTKITFICKKQYNSFIVKNCKGLGAFSIVFMNFRETIVKFKLLIK